ncbi:MAG: hypothetical protein ACJART_002050 [Maribacter sp.]|jgi:hypothetical protein
MKTNLLYKLLVIVLICSVLLICYGIVEHIFDIYLFRNNLLYGAILFQIVVLLIIFYKIAKNRKFKKPIGNLLGVAAVLATAFIGATYLYVAIMEAFSR